MTDTYQMDFSHIEEKDKVNAQLARCVTWTDFEDVYFAAWANDFVLVSKRRNGVMIYHIQKADVKRKGQDLAFYLVNDGVHAGACAIPNLHKFFYFRKSTNAEWAVLKEANPTTGGLIHD